MARKLHRAFTLVEMLVVLGIIAVLAALLLPAAMGAVTRARNAALGIEVNQLATAIQSYKDDKGDYPPNFRPGMEQAFLNHVRRCYPKIAPTELGWFFAGTTPYPDGTPRFNLNRIPDEGEALVFWLSHTTTDPRYPFGLTVPATQSVNYKKYYEFDESRLESIDTPPAPPLPGEPPRPIELPSYKAKFCKDTYYTYIDSRAYNYFARNFGNRDDDLDMGISGPFYAFAEGDHLPLPQHPVVADESKVRPYWSDIQTEYGKANPMKNLTWVRRYKPMNETTFQVLCAGQDGNFGLTEADDNIKVFPAGDYYTKADRDNLTSFSAGKRLEDSAGKQK